jgi:hypothetical protein
MWDVEMKVYIGPYGTYISAYKIQDWIMEKKYTIEKWWHMEPEQMDRFDLFVEKVIDGIQFVLNKTINKITDRDRTIKVRIDGYDTWSMDHTLALIIHPMLVQLKETNHGYFTPDPEDVPHIGKGEETDYSYSDTLALDRYNWIMDELIWTFESLKSNDEFDLFYTEENGWDMEGRDKHDARIKNGLRLFGKYYRALWD